MQTLKNETKHNRFFVDFFSQCETIDFLNWFMTTGFQF